MKKLTASALLASLTPAGCSSDVQKGDEQDPIAEEDSSLNQDLTPESEESPSIFTESTMLPDDATC